MIKKLAKVIVDALVPILLDELVYKLEELLKEDFNKDGKIGK